MGSGLILIQSCTKEEVKYPDDFTYGEVTDSEGNVYKTIQVEIPSGGIKGPNVTQIWMAENLKTTKYSNGDKIETTTPAILDISKDPSTLLNYQWAYGGEESYVDTYGRLYTWGAVMDSRNICPEGWHVPSKAEWSQLAEFLEGKFVEDWEGMGYWSYVGGKLKEAGTEHWKSTNTGAVNSIGMTALPGGLRNNLDVTYFYGISEKGVWWSSTEDLNRNYRWAWTYSAGYLTAHLWTMAYHVNDGLSVRCMQQISQN